MEFMELIANIGAMESILIIGAILFVISYFFGEDKTKEDIKYKPIDKKKDEHIDYKEALRNYKRNNYKPNNYKPNNYKPNNYKPNNYDNIETHIETDRYVERKSHEIVSQIDSISTNKAYRKSSREMSKGERLINEILKEQDFMFEREYQFNSRYRGINMHQYFYDFVIFSTTGKIIAVIEYHGEQHYNYVAIYQQTLNDLTKQKETDKLKKEFIVSQGITYIEIPYYWGLDKEKISNYINLQTIKRYT